MIWNTAACVQTCTVWLSKWNPNSACLRLCLSRASETRLCPTTCALFHHEMSQSEFIIKQEATQPEQLLLLDCWITDCITSSLNPICSSIPPHFLLCISKSTLGSKEIRFIAQSCNPSTLKVTVGGLSKTWDHPGLRNYKKMSSGPSHSTLCSPCHELGLSLGS